MRGKLLFSVLVAVTAVALGCTPTGSGVTGGSGGGVEQDAASPGCSLDIDCNQGAHGVGVVCSAGECVQGCHSAVDCPNGGICDLTTSPGQCAAAPPQCTSDTDCNSGQTGTGVICSDAGKCVAGCHAAADCPDGDICEAGDCAPPPLCKTDVDCNNGMTGTALICSTSGQCVDGCHAAADCPTGSVCDQTQCVAAPTCPVLTYPSGIKIQTVANAAMTATYQGHLKAGEQAPVCFLDVGNLYDPNTNETYDLSVHVATNFRLSELVGTEVDQGWGSYVLMSPDAVVALQAFRNGVGGPVSVNSGFRGPKHQESVCNDLCGDPMGCPGTCANNSRHMWGDAFDLPDTFYSQYYSDLACQSGFKFVYLESGTHLHVDMNPEYTQCVQQ